MKKFIFITGGVVSSLGKGLTAASLASLLEHLGCKVSLIKFDPYLNVDPGTMSPFEHGEVYVTEDGAETDLDIGHYYRFTNAHLTKHSNVTAGQIYETVLKKERQGEFLGKTVQVIPHITDEIKNHILSLGSQEPSDNVASSGKNIVIVEIGGTVGDIESQPFLEAIRQFRNEHPHDCVNLHLTYVPYLRAAGEVKTKPTQQSVQLLRGIGIIPDFLVCRSEQALSPEIKEKIALFCSVPVHRVIDEPDVEHSIYEVPLALHKEGLDQKICQFFSLPLLPQPLRQWEKIVYQLLHPQGEVHIGIVGKYVQHKDAYKSVFEALQHAAIFLQKKLILHLFESEKILQDGKIIPEVKGLDGYLIPGGFGERGWMGKLMTVKYCREEKVPFFGICLGMQAMTVEFARHVLGFPLANSTEMDISTPDPVISLLSEQQAILHKGGTMRRGVYPCELKENSLAKKAYQKPLVKERHRHRFEFNQKYKELFAKKGLHVTGHTPDHQLTEIIEIENHPWMVGVQFHPEFTSKPFAPHPLFVDFIKASSSHE